MIRDEEKGCVQLLKDRFGSRRNVWFEYAGAEIDNVDGKTYYRCSFFGLIRSELVVELVTLDLDTCDQTGLRLLPCNIPLTRLFPACAMSIALCRPSFRLTASRCFKYCFKC